MLKSFGHFNETVFRGPDDEGGSGGDQGGLDSGQGLEDVGEGGNEGGAPPDEPSEPLTVREQIKRSMQEASEAGSAPAKKRDAKTGRPVKGAQEAAPAAPTEPAKPAAPAVAAPASLPAEAKAEWEKTPPAIQAAFVKREQDMERGVNELKSKYSLIDQALAPHTDALRQMNATPGEAVNRMFLWFKALAGNPTASFPQLAQSMGIDWQKLIASQTGGQQPQGTAQGAAPALPPEVKTYVGGLERQLSALTNYVTQMGSKFGTVEQTLNSQNEARTRENLNLWSTGKEFFEDVRQDMAKLIETGIVPLKDGQVDLDTAYERAIYLNPDVRTRVLAKQQQANQDAQQAERAAATTAAQAQVGRARKAAASLPSGSPGPVPGAGTKKPGQKSNVRDSLKAAIAELRDQ